MTPANLLWTGGWDSSFRLLMLVLEERRPAQPYYVFDRGRPSSPVELAAQGKIRAAVAGRDPAAADLIRPTIVVEDRDIPAFPEITERYRRLARAKWIGGQYEFVARLAEHLDITNLELCVLGVERVSQQHLVGNVEEVNGISRLKRDPPSPDHELFRRLSFPLFNLTKAKMRAIAAERGFADIMDLTWFCHTPQNGKPCGRCNPCLYAMKNGFGSRIPLLARIKSKIRRRKPEEVPVA